MYIVCYTGGEKKDFKEEEGILMLTNFAPFLPFLSSYALELVR